MERLAWEEGRKKMAWGPNVSQWREERQQGHCGLYENTEVCEWVKEHQRRIKWHGSKNGRIVMANFEMDEL